MFTHSQVISLFMILTYIAKEKVFLCDLQWHCLYKFMFIPEEVAEASRKFLEDSQLAHNLPK
jgi:hypothetical protein